MRQAYAMTMLQTFAADVAAVEPEMPVIGIFNGKSYTGQQPPSSDNQEFADAGIIPRSDLDWLVRTEIFDTPPAKNEEITIANIVYRVDSFTKAQDGVTILYHLVLRT